MDRELRFGVLTLLRRPTRSWMASVRFVEEYGDAGISEFIVYYPFREENFPYFMSIAREIIPEFRDDAV